MVSYIYTGEISFTTIDGTLDAYGVGTNRQPR